MISNNLLSYNIVDIKLDYNMSKGEVYVEKNNQAEVSRNVKPSRLDINVKDAFVHIDTTAARASLDQDAPEAFAKRMADKGYQAFMKSVQDYVSIGNQIGRLHQGATIAGVYKNKHLSECTRCETIVEFLPSAPAEITVDPYDMDINYTPAEMDADWRAHQYSLGYTPARFDQITTQQPYIDIKYVGDYIYV